MAQKHQFGARDNVEAAMGSNSVQKYLADRGLPQMRGACLAHGGGEGGESGLGQEALVVAPGAGARLVMDGDVVARLRSYCRPDQALMRRLTSMASWVRFMVSFSQNRGYCVRAAAQRMKAGERCRSGLRRMQEPTRNSPISRRRRVA